MNPSSATPTAVIRNATDAQAQVVRDMIRHEDNLTNHRITWLTSVQGLLFASLAFAWKDAGDRHLPLLLAAMGAAIAFSSFLSLLDAGKASRKLRRWWDEHASPDYQGPDVVGLRGSEVTLRVLKPWRLLPWVFIAGWTAVACLDICR